MKFRIGKFTYVNDLSETVLITRKANRQEERIPATGVITKFKLQWITPCEYKITQVWSNSKAKRKQNRSATKVIITRTLDNGYEYTCACDPDVAKTTKGVVVKLE